LPLVKPDSPARTRQSLGLEQGNGPAKIAGIDKAPSRQADRR
jgi:hypothetical protein